MTDKALDKTEYLNDKLKNQVVLAKMNENMKTLQKDVHEIKSDIKDFIDDANTKFAKKHDMNKLNGKVNYLITTLVSLLIASVVALIKLVYESLK